MSRHAFGTVWNQGYMLPVHHGSSSGEAFPKRVPADGCGFNGVPGDVPPEKILWYTGGGNSFSAGGHSLKGRGRNSGNVTLKSTGAFDFDKYNADHVLLPHGTMGSSASLPNLANVQSREMSAEMASIAEAHAQNAMMAPGNENSHLRMYYGQHGSRVKPETLQIAGVSTFKMRRFQETNTSIPRLEH
mmetsp:Transcript_39866/g.71658  ORF Transcript_39866/g.71658 Transcript_39866/m.71658 type:complete len:188 (+) Transcript_39866:74-637(+)|eukprot:CAMPEP_0197664660 /NCGR_PEP_ID=MMETSP1338-20131121/58770_1 /TAXON_ID=43686 ORGANISM="Pelagodinium beii, Strain RCC1491" /NCGR_SAMPLE_ID=MMETSP1338 /ASSEMBLY_ACC=CAM_ASM_000754 /LENGTH=187 /DNA_ID=CAMNT_0043243349 /DNA_START=54 /DNA_END=617 /DNA_ORIENTATION=-